MNFVFKIYSFLKFTLELFKWIFSHYFVFIFILFSLSQDQPLRTESNFFKFDFFGDFLWLLFFG